MIRINERDGKKMANIITILRILGTLLLSVTVPMTGEFFVLYTLTGVTDVLDGYIARKTNTVSEFGSKLDSAADLMFYGIVLYRILPMLSSIIPAGIWYVVIGIIILRVFTYVFTAIKYEVFMSNHTYLNKLTGLCVFLIPYIMKIPGAIVMYCAGTCVVCAAASVYDLILSFKKS